MTDQNTFLPDGNASAATVSELKDYFCPFCNHKLFRGNVNEFKLVCQECNRLVDSRNLDNEAETSGEAD
ncbi:MAG: hypothetical protein V6Z89_09630 [Desulfobacter sp.]